MLHHHHLLTGRNSLSRNCPRRGTVRDQQCSVSGRPQSQVYCALCVNEGCHLRLPENSGYSCTQSVHCDRQCLALQANGRGYHSRCRKIWSCSPHRSWGFGSLQRRIPASDNCPQIQRARWLIVTPGFTMPVRPQKAGTSRMGRRRRESTREILCRTHWKTISRALGCTFHCQQSSYSAKTRKRLRVKILPKPKMLPKPRSTVFNN